MYGSEREREGDRMRERKKKVLTVKGKRERERRHERKGLVLFFCSLVDPGLAEAGQKRQHTPPWQTLERLMRLLLHPGFISTIHRTTLWSDDWYVPKITKSRFSFSLLLQTKLPPYMHVRAHTCSHFQCENF